MVNDALEILSRSSVQELEVEMTGALDECKKEEIAHFMNDGAHIELLKALLEKAQVLQTLPKEHPNRHTMRTQGSWCHPKTSLKFQRALKGFENADISQVDYLEIVRLCKLAAGKLDPVEYVPGERRGREICEELLKILADGMQTRELRAAALALSTRWTFAASQTYQLVQSLWSQESVGQWEDPYYQALFGLGNLIAEEGAHLL
jgi:hypothetical protein